MGIRKKKVVKRKKGFVRNQCDLFARVDESWRRPKGIDSAQRRKFKGNRLMPNIGYGGAKKTRHAMPDGFLKFRVFNVADLEMLLMNNRKAIVDRAAQLNIKVINGGSKLLMEESEESAGSIQGHRTDGRGCALRSRFDRSISTERTASLS